MCTVTSPLTVVWCSLLADPSLQATVFVPADRAWGSLLRVLGWPRDRLLHDQTSRDALRTVLQVGARARARERLSIRRREEAAAIDLDP